MASGIMPWAVGYDSGNAGADADSAETCDANADPAMVEKSKEVRRSRQISETLEQLPVHLRKARPTIFVSIPSYRDPETRYTVLDLLRKATYPERVTVGVCWQVDRVDDAHCFLIDLTDYHENVREVFIHHSEARGPCFARSLIETELLEEEDFVLQLDSHYRMIEGWDAELVDQIRRCNSERPIITTYPSSYTLPDDYIPGDPDRARMKEHGEDEAVALCAREFGSSDGFLRITGKAVNASALGGEPFPSLFWAAGFSFAPRQAHEMVPYDPNLEHLFFGEEPSMAARFWTNGWDFFSPSKIVGHHLWTRKFRPVFREHTSAETKALEKSAAARVRSLLRQPMPVEGEGVDVRITPVEDMGIYGLGKVRSLSQYTGYTGVDHVMRTISRHALRGGLHSSAFVAGDPSSGVRASSASVSLPAILGLMPNAVAGAIGAMLEEEPEPPPPPPALVSQRLQFGTAPAGLQILRQSDLDQFDAAGFVVIDGFLRRSYGHLGEEAAFNAYALAHNAAREIPLRTAGLGRGAQIWNNMNIRGDEMAWLSPPHGDGLRARALRRVLSEREPRATVGLVDRENVSNLTEWNSDGSKQEAHYYGDLDPLLVQFSILAEDLDLLLVPPTSRMSIMVARYPGGGMGYRRHRDSLPEHGLGRRRITAIYYLNDKWEPSHGGQLRAYVPPEMGPKLGCSCRTKFAKACNEFTDKELLDTANAIADESISLDQSLLKDEWSLDIEPIADRLVLLASDWLEHEVLPSATERYAITAWYY
eukprot:TRINITY_DN2007_c0_g1_i1.p1 TRINITY_DN2007_c0_g1~~TRINITY_DN2007_c0_g1_i1.p1  ORF type:complete len:785 (+),score=102.36 TRINITY_DN2007_c0_g1_i1:65-2356(+)